MAVGKKFLSGGTAAGTGTGTLLDPWNPNDVLIVGNPKSLVGGDVVLFKIDPTDPVGTKTTVTANLVTWVNNGWSGLLTSCDLSGAPTRVAAVLDGVSLGSGTILALSTSYASVKNIAAINSPGNAFDITGYGCTLENFSVDSPAGYGVYSVATVATIRHGVIDTSVNNGIYVSGSLSAVLENYIKGTPIGKTSIYIINMLRGLVAGNVVACPASVSAPGIFIESGAGCICASNTVYAPSAASGPKYGIRSQSEGAQIVGNIVYGWNNTSNKAISGSGTAAVIKENVAYDCTAYDYGSLSPWLSEAINQIDPEFTDAANGNFTVGADLSNIFSPERLGDEAARLIPGAIQGAGGGGSSGSPRIRTIHTGGRM